MFKNEELNKKIRNRVKDLHKVDEIEKESE